MALATLLSAAIVVQFSNLAAVPAPVMAAAQIEVNAVFEETGVQIEPTAPDADGGGRSVLHVVVIPRRGGAFAHSQTIVLGSAMTTSNGTRVAWIYYEPIAAEAAAYSVPIASVLACAIAHELGHLLLPVLAHADAGLMRASWGQPDFRRAARGSLRFSEDEGKQMRAAIETSLLRDRP
jgi:hypothetical protein